MDLEAADAPLGRPFPRWNGLRHDDGAAHCQIAPGDSAPDDERRQQRPAEADRGDQARPRRCAHQEANPQQDPGRRPENDQCKSALGTRERRQQARYGLASAFVRITLEAVDVSAAHFDEIHPGVVVAGLQEQRAFEMQHRQPALALA